MSKILLYYLLFVPYSLTSRFLALVPLKLSQLQLLASACLMVAWKVKIIIFCPVSSMPYHPNPIRIDMTIEFNEILIPLDFNTVIPSLQSQLQISLKVREDRQIRVETILKYSNYNIKADELLVGFTSKHSSAYRSINAFWSLETYVLILNFQFSICLDVMIIMCLDVLMSRVLELGNVIGSPGSCLARVRFRTSQELTIDRQLLLGLHQLHQLLIYGTTPNCPSYGTTPKLLPMYVW